MKDKALKTLVNTRFSGGGQAKSLVKLGFDGIKYFVCGKLTDRHDAFTLAEALMTLVVIGVIAALLLPSFNSDVNQKVDKTQKQVFTQKLDMGLHSMQLAGDLAKQYSTTSDFVHALSKYMKIAKICPNTKLTSCFADKVYITRKAEKFNTSSVSTSANVDINFSTPADLVGVVFANGMTALVAYNPNCMVEDRFSNNANVTKCLGMYYDINGKEGPNIIDEDIITMSVGSKKNWTDMISEPFYPMNYTQSEMRAATERGSVKQLYYSSGEPLYYSKGMGNWVGANDECFSKGKDLPTTAQMQQIAQQLYGVNINGNYNSRTDAPGGIVDQELWNKLGGSPIAIMISANDFCQYANYRMVYFSQNFVAFVQSTDSGTYQSVGMPTSGITIKAVCVDED